MTASALSASHRPIVYRPSPGDGAKRGGRGWHSRPLEWIGGSRQDVCVTPFLVTEGVQTRRASSGLCKSRRFFNMGNMTEAGEAPAVPANCTHKGAKDV